MMVNIQKCMYITYKWLVSKNKMLVMFICTIIPPAEAILNVASNITHRPLIDADDRGR